MDARVDTPAAPVAPTNAARIERFEFSATGSEYFRIWIVNLLLTIVTLGFYSAWAKVRRLRYFYGSTSLAGSSFEYHGQPQQILKGRLIVAPILIAYFVVGYLFPGWDLLFVLLFALLLPVIVVKSRLFSMRMTSWRNIRFNFAGTYGRAYGVYVGYGLLALVTLGLMFPYWTWARQKFVIGQSKFGATPFEFRAGVGDYYVANIVGSFIMGGGALLGLLLMIPFFGLGSDFGRTEMVNPDFGPGMFIFIPVMIVGYLLGFAFMQSWMHNAAFSKTFIGSHRLDCKLEVMPLFWLYLGNSVAALVSLGLLIPWAQVRLIRYQLDRMNVHVSGNLDEFVAGEQSAVAATGEEFGDLLDVDFGL